MRNRADWRKRRPLALAAAAAALAVPAAAGASVGLLRSTAPVAKATQSHGAPIWIAGRHTHAAHAVRSSARTARHAASRLAGSAPAAATTVVDLCAKEGSATMPGGSSVPIWGFALLGSAPSCDDPSVVAQLPGPVLDVNQGDTVTLNVTNALTARTISMQAPGIDFAAGPQDAAPGATVSMTFTASSEGTYLYSSAGDYGRQEAMGLYGALVVHPAAANQAYGNSFDVQRVLVLSEVDPAFNAAPDSFDMNNWHPAFWLINGQGYPDTPMIDVPAGQTLLLRYLNAGADNNTMTMLGLHGQLIARDAYQLNDPFEVVSETFPSGETAEALVNVPSGASSGTKFALYNRNLNMQMMTFVDVP